jgi:hypothetical protein
MARLVPPGTEVLAGLEMGGIPVVCRHGEEIAEPWFHALFPVLLPVDLRADIRLQLFQLLANL